MLYSTIDAKANTSLPLEDDFKDAKKDKPLQSHRYRRYRKMEETFKTIVRNADESYADT